jgi:hypothetical protein
VALALCMDAASFLLQGGLSTVPLVLPPFYDAKTAAAAAVLLLQPPLQLPQALLPPPPPPPLRSLRPGAAVVPAASWHNGLSHQVLGAGARQA